MPGYSFPRAHGPALKDGRQRMTLAAPRAQSAASHHAAVGDAVQLGLVRDADKPFTRLGERRCILRAVVVIEDSGLIRLDAVRYRERDEWTAQAERLARFLRAAEQGAPGDTAVAREAVARLCGFRSWKALWAWNNGRDRRSRPDADGRVTRELIGWAV